MHFFFFHFAGTPLTCQVFPSHIGMCALCYNSLSPSFPLLRPASLQNSPSTLGLGSCARPLQENCFQLWAVTAAAQLFSGFCSPNQRVGKGWSLLTRLTVLRSGYLCLGFRVAFGLCQQQAQDPSDKLYQCTQLRELKEDFREVGHSNCLGNLPFLQ